jgi:hypothetical protein
MLGKTLPRARALRALSTAATSRVRGGSRLDELVHAFQKDVAAHCPSDGKRVVFPTAHLVSDNAIIHLFKVREPPCLHRHPAAPRRVALRATL